MADRPVRASKKDQDGDILALCNEGLAWSPRKNAEVINDIETKTHTYYVRWGSSGVTEIRVIDGPTGKYLRTDTDSTPKNNLDDLPDC